MRDARTPAAWTDGAPETGDVYTDQATAAQATEAARIAAAAIGLRFRVIIALATAIAKTRILRLRAIRAAAGPGRVA